jgi:hypothetical protein
MKTDALRPDQKAEEPTWAAIWLTLLAGGLLVLYIAQELLCQ